MIKSYILYSLSIISIVILSVLTTISITLIDISPVKKIIIIFLTLLLILYILIKLFLSRKNYLYNIGALISIITNVILLYNITIMNSEYSVIENLFYNNYYYEVYDLYVLKNTIYQNKDDLLNKKIGIIEENNENINELLNKRIKANYLIYHSEKEAIDSLKNGEIQSLVIPSSHNKINNLKSIYKFKVKKDKTNKHIY